MSSLRQSRALVLQSPGCVAIVDTDLSDEYDVPEGYILVKTTAVALNPSDWKHVDFLMVGDPTGARAGFDYAGVVAKTGPGLPNDIKLGDRVFGFSNGANIRKPQEGAFGNYVLGKAGLAARVPDKMDDTKAVAIGGVGVATVGQGLYQDLGVPLPTTPRSKRPLPLLIYGGSTASGALGIQFAKMSNCTVATTCSPKNFDYVKKLGADFVVDYHEADCADQIRGFFAGGRRRLCHVWDCIATVESARICASAMCPRLGGHYSSLMFVSPAVLKGINPLVKCTMTFGFTIMGEDLEKDTLMPARPEDYEFAKTFFGIAQQLLHEGKFEPVRPIVNHGGRNLEGVICGLDYLRRGKVSAAKLVYTMD